jgi:small-conductance mechanosensitive channel/CRP-like cAMP-binding protein
VTPNLAIGLATAFALGGFLVPFVIARTPLWPRVLAGTIMFAGLSASLPFVVGSPFHPIFDPGPGRHLLEQLLEAAWWIVAGRAVVGFTRLLVVIEHKPRETRLVSDLVSGAIYVCVILATVNFAFGVPVRGLLATSGVIAIVLGLALQSTMADVFAGIALGIERPYETGDLVWFEGDIEGTVVQVNWRSTHIQTGNDDVAVVPNSVVAKSKLVNRSHPTSLRSDSVSIILTPDAPPSRCIGILRDAATGCIRMLNQPKPNITIARVGGDGVHYSISFAVASSAHLLAARTELLDQVSRHLRFTGIGFAVPGTPAGKLLPPATRQQILNASRDLDFLSPADQDLIASKMTDRTFAPGEVMVTQGDIPGSVLILASGAVGIAHNTPDQEIRRYPSLSPGDFIGLVGLLVGEPYPISATALTICLVYELKADDLREFMQAYPHLADILVALAHRIYSSFGADDSVAPSGTLGRNDQLLVRLRSFFGLS